jgi:adenine-specific DNA-methyltransferase
MNLTDYHAKYFAHELTKRCSSDSIEKLAGAVASAQVDLNPHQVDAALFAFNSPLSKGALLADEVGLGKTIEAGLVLSQRWAERKRRVLVITPSNLRKQWHQELTEKFFLPCKIFETKSYNDEVKRGNFRPLEAPDTIVICSFQFARNRASDVANAAWDLIVVDEAHRLRNVYKPSNVIANTLKLALAGKNKLLLTATPLQNSLLELFGLVSFIDEHTFGDLKSFREQFANLTQEQVFHTPASLLIHSLHQAPADGGGVHAGGKRRPPLQPRHRISLPRQPSGAPCQPTLADYTRAAQTAGFFHLCDRRGARNHVQASQGQAPEGGTGGIP